MWNLTGEDIKRARDELSGRRAAIQARYEAELKKLEEDIADLETFERFAVKFVSDFKGESAAAPAEAAALEAEPEPVSADVVAEIVAQVTADPPAASPEPALEAISAEANGSAPEAPQKATSRWRMRLNAGEASA